jgi:hypothetical protein
MRDQWPVTAVLDEFGIRHGRNRAACPICQGRNTQAFAFGKPTPTSWHCFSCHAGGDSIKLHALLAGLDTGAAIRDIARRLGLTTSAPAALAARTTARRIASRHAQDLADARSHGEARLMRWIRADLDLVRTERSLARSWGQSEVALWHAHRALAALESAGRWERLLEAEAARQWAREWAA